MLQQFESNSSKGKLRMVSELMELLEITKN